MPLRSSRARLSGGAADGGSSQALTSAELIPRSDFQTSSQFSELKFRRDACLDDRFTAVKFNSN